MPPIFNQELSSGYTERFDYDVNGNLIYDGWAMPGTLSSAPGWVIKRYTYTGANVTLIEWAGASEFLQNVWDNRAALAYS